MSRARLRAMLDAMRVALPAWILIGAAGVACSTPQPGTDGSLFDAHGSDAADVSIDATPADPLVGLWITHSYPIGLPRDLLAYEQDLTIAADGTYALATISTRAPDAPRPDCIETIRSSGGHWQRGRDDAGDTIAFSGSSPSTLERRQCSDPSLDQPPTVTTIVGDPPMIDHVMLDADTLTLVPIDPGGVPSFYTRQ